MAKSKINIEEAMRKEHDKLFCTYCNQELPPNNFYPSASRNSMMRLDNRGINRMIICKDCAQQLFLYLCKAYKTPEKALYYFCAMTDTFFDEGAARKIEKQDMAEFIDTYFTIVLKDVKFKARSFTDSDTIKKNIGEPEEIAKEEVFDEIDLANRREVLQFYHHNPFENESIADQKQLLRDACSMISEDMAEDLPKQRAAISLVRSYLRLDKITEAIQTLSDSPDKTVRNAKDIKTLTEMAQKESAMITQATKDHGFSEKYATARTRGSGSLSAIVKEIEDNGYDAGRVNIYDVKTEKSMRLAADISNASILKQIALGDSEYADIVKRQHIIIQELNEENLRLNEECRLVYEQITKQELLKELAKKLEEKKLGEREIQDLVLSEIHYSDEEIGLLKERREKKKEKKDD